jgi:hypothetical protein
VSVPSVVVPPLNVSVTVTVPFVRDVGLVNANDALPEAVPAGVDACDAFHVAVAVFVPAAAVGAAACAHV